MKQSIGRFAPSPTGRMHLGNVYAALLSWLSVKSKGGRWLLRIEDIDPQRSKRDYALQLMDDLQWLGLPWDGDVVWQSQRGDIYQSALEALRDKGLLYLSYKTRAERLAVSAPQQPSATPDIPEKSDILDLSTHRSAGAETLRVDDRVVEYDDGHYGPQRVDLRKDIGDFVVRRRDGAWAYQLAVVVDDMLMGMTEIVRGRDLLQSAGQQLYLRELLSDSAFLANVQNHVSEEQSCVPQFIHFPLLVNAAGQRLAKRDKSLHLGVLKERYSAPEIIGMLAYYADIIPEPQPVSPQELLSLFSWDNVPTKDILTK